MIVGGLHLPGELSRCLRIELFRPHRFQVALQPDQLQLFAFAFVDVLRVNGSQFLPALVASLYRLVPAFVEVFQTIVIIQTGLPSFAKLGDTGSAGTAGTSDARCVNPVAQPAHINRL